VYIGGYYLHFKGKRKREKGIEEVNGKWEIKPDNKKLFSFSTIRLFN